MVAAFPLAVSMPLSAPLTQTIRQLPYALLTQWSSPPGRESTRAEPQDPGSRATKQVVEAER